MRRQSAVVALVFTLCAVSLHGQTVVTDPAVTIRNSITAILKEYVLNTQREQHRQLRRMSRRLSMFTDLRKYALPDPPRWRTHDFENPDAFLFARGYHAALNYGDAAGSAYLAVSHPVVAAGALLTRLDADARRSVMVRLATLDATDASTIAATNDTGQTRYNGRRELAAISALEAHVIEPSQTQNATAVLDKISGASLIGGRQRQARTQLLAGVVEQLLVDNKRARDAEASAMNMQLVTWRDARRLNDAFGTGTGDALRTWRQP
jgi:hypothetical protein